MFIISLLAAAAAAGTPTYLSCRFDGGEPILFTADEANSAVTMNVPSTGYIEKMPAAFTAEAVRFRDRAGMLSYEISRTNLGILRGVTSLGKSEPGTCKVEAAPKRAF